MKTGILPCAVRAVLWKTELLWQLFWLNRMENPLSGNYKLVYCCYFLELELLSCEFVSLGLWRFLDSLLHRYFLRNCFSLFSLMQEPKKGQSSSVQTRGNCRLVTKHQARVYFWKYKLLVFRPFDNTNTVFLDFNSFLKVFHNFFRVKKVFVINPPIFDRCFILLVDKVHRYIDILNFQWDPICA